MLGKANGSEPILAPSHLLRDLGQLIQGCESVSSSLKGKLPPPSYRIFKVPEDYAWY